MLLNERQNQVFLGHRLLVAIVLAVSLAVLPATSATAQIDTPERIDAPEPDYSLYNDTYYPDDYQLYEDEDYEPFEYYEPEDDELYDQYDELGYEDGLATDDALPEVDVDHFRSGAYIYGEDSFDPEIYGESIDTGFSDRPYLGVEPYDQDIREGTPFWRYEDYYDAYYDVTDEASVDEEQIYSNTQEYLIESNDYGWFFNQATDAWEFGYHDQDQLYDDYQFDEFDEFVEE